MKFERYKCQIWKDTWYLIPTISIRFNDPIYFGKNCAIMFHFLCIHMRWFWIEERD